MSLTPVSTAEIAMNSESNASAINRASVVLPEPGGPHRIIECGLPAANATASGLPGASRCRWPTTSSIDFGRSRSASGTEPIDAPEKRSSFMFADFNYARYSPPLRRRFPWALAAAAAYAIVVAPVLGLMQTGPQIAADRYTYLSCLPWAVLLAAAVCRRPRLLSAAAVALVLLGVLTWRQTRIWKDTQSLWNHALRVDPENYFAHLNLGWERQVHGDFDGAYSHYGEALRINPKFTFAYNNRGSLLQTRGQYEAAMADFAAAIEANPLYESPYLNRGTLRLARGDLDGAIADLSEAIRLVPSDGRPYNNRGLARREKNDVAGAAADFHEALARFPPGTPGRQMIEGNLADLEESAGKRAPD